MDKSRRRHQGGFFNTMKIYSRKATDASQRQLAKLKVTMEKLKADANILHQKMVVNLEKGHHLAVTQINKAELASRQMMVKAQNVKNAAMQGGKRKKTRRHKKRKRRKIHKRKKTRKRRHY